MKSFYLIIASLSILFMHEMGHYLAAKIIGLKVEKVSFSMRPLPRFYVSVIDQGISFTKRLLYYISGNMVTLLVFIILNFIDFNGVRLLRIVVAIQIIIETNPFYSDYSTVLFWISNKSRINRLSQPIYNAKQEKEINNYLEQIKEEYFLSPIWFIHFTIWTILLIFLLEIYY